MNEYLFLTGTSPALIEHDTEKTNFSDDYTRRELSLTFGLLMQLVHSLMPLETLVLGTFTLPSTVNIHQRENRENLWLP